MIKRKKLYRHLPVFALILTILITGNGISRNSCDTAYAAGNMIMRGYASVGDEKTFTDYDMTGDGKKDTLKLKVTHNSAVIYINGKKVYTKKAGIFESVNMLAFKRKGEAPLIVLKTDWYSQMFSVLLQYKSGKLVQKLNLYDKRGFGEVTKTTGNKMTILFDGKYCVGNGAFSYTYSKKHGKWISSKYGIYNKKYMPSSSGLIAAKDFSVYQNYASKRKSSVIKKGTKCKVKKCILYKGKFYIQLNYRGKKGWIVDRGVNAGLFSNIVIAD